MESRTVERSRPYEERVEMAGRLIKEFLNSELLKVLVEREQRQIGSGGPGPSEREAPRWLHKLLDIIWDILTS